MTQIPADIMEKAFEIVEAMYSNKHDALTAGDSRYANMLTDDANAVALAIIAERERAARIGYAICAETRHVTLGQQVRDAILKGEA